MRVAPIASVALRSTTRRVLTPLRAQRVSKSMRATRSTQICRASMGDLPAALLFDCDGVLVDTEKDGHRVTFNQAFAEKGLDAVWGVEQYGELVKIGGGKERMTKFFSDSPTQEPWASLKTAEEQQAYIKEMHLLKTGLFMQMIETGALQLRPGVARLVGEAIAAGVPVAVCSTSSEQAVSTIVRVLLGAGVAGQMPVYAGDAVPKKKPSPDIYLLAARQMGLEPSNCVVVEDSHIGVMAAKAAGMRCVVTKSGYTADEDFSSADAVFNYIGDKGDEQFSLDDLRLNSPLWPGCGSSEDGEVGEEEFCLYSMDDSMDEGSEGSK